MFGFLKKKLSTFGEKLKKNVEKKEEFEKPLEKKIKQEIVQNIEETQEIEKTIKKSKQIEKPKKNKEHFEEIKRNVEIKKVEEDKRELKANISTKGKIKSFFSKQIEIKENDIEELIFELELSLIESDVEQETAKEITEQIKNKLIGKKISTKNLNEYLKKIINEILQEMMTTQKIDLLKEIKINKKPYKIIMLGPNGAGKTTSIAKLTYLFQKNGLTCVWAASDTFRSGAIDQLNEHAQKLNVKVIKQQYGADPAAVAFDAIKSAEANKNDVILIDTAGRQETNKNLMEELKKIERIIKPNLKIYVGEAYTGQGLLEMAREFDEKIGIDCFILTKIDTDAKGGTTISLLYKTKKPIIFIGTGQEYEDFKEFEPEFILKRII
ncbi:MAG: signal recognition particle-docking protein FtsY [Candidatus ainarchaeum sp.]|nr:signal recognition particle-docking protein FtsY [Candidatus ainarchaeum sp.]